jgi:hypothetical protein
MNFLKWFLGRGCSHQFTWPRIDANGRHYQICPLCGTAYEYDWRMMRRTDRLLVTNGQHPLALARNPSRNYQLTESSVSSPKGCP